MQTSGIIQAYLMTELSAGEQTRIFTEQQKDALRTRVIVRARAENSQLATRDPQELTGFVRGGIELINEFEKAARPHPPIYKNTDVVYLDSGPGPYSKKFPPFEDKPDVNYHEKEWTRKMDRARVRTGVVVMHNVVAQRTGKTIGEVTPEDIREHCPLLLYTATPWEVKHIRGVFDQLRNEGIFKIPEEKIFMYDHIVGEDGRERPIVHTVDQMEGLHFPDGVVPQRIVVVSHPAHLLRVLHMMEKFKDRIPEGTIVQPFPLPTPLGASMEYAEMELLGDSCSDISL